jgi:crotonobetainyl-CoA:carnitine CoA-transferase CaiB-like acyl-CoA transferase
MTQRSPLGQPTAAGPLAGVRVVDLTTSYAGPTASMYLADLGADVVKVERPGVGDDARGWGPPFVNGMSAWFASANRNKRSVVLNLGSAEARELLHSMVGQADVFMESMNPVKLERLGLEPAVLMARFPRLVYCAMSGYGLDGPDKRMPGYDLAAQARSGLMSVTGAKGGPPQRVSTALSDIVTGMSAALAISAALLRQRTDGTGDLLDVSLLDTDLALMAPRIAAFLAGEPEPAPSGGTDSVLSIYQAFQTADRDIVVAIGNDGMWQRFCAAVALPELAGDPELCDNAGRRANRDRITELIAGRLSQRPAAQWLKVFAEAQVPSSLVQTLSEVVADPQVEARESVLPVPGTDRLYSIRSPFRLASVGELRNSRCPELGAHTSEVLGELGLSRERIRELARAGAVQLAAGSQE